MSRNNSSMVKAGQYGDLIFQFPVFRYLAKRTDEITTRGIETSNRTRVNLIPINEASNIIMGIRQTAANPM